MIDAAVYPDVPETSQLYCTRLFWQDVVGQASPSEVPELERIVGVSAIEHSAMLMQELLAHVAILQDLRSGTQRNAVAEQESRAALRMDTARGAVEREILKSEIIRLYRAVKDSTLLSDRDHRLMEMLSGRPVSAPIPRTRPASARSGGGGSDGGSGGGSTSVPDGVRPTVENFETIAGTLRHVMSLERQDLLDDINFVTRLTEQAIDTAAARDVERVSTSVPELRRFEEKLSFIARDMTLAGRAGTRGERRGPSPGPAATRPLACSGMPAHESLGSSRKPPRAIVQGSWSGAQEEGTDSPRRPSSVHKLRSMVARSRK